MVVATEAPTHVTLPHSQRVLTSPLRRCYYKWTVNLPTGADLTPAFRADTPALGAPMPGPRDSVRRVPKYRLMAQLRRHSTAPARDLSTWKTGDILLIENHLLYTRYSQSEPLSLGASVKRRQGTPGTHATRRCHGVAGVGLQ